MPMRPTIALSLASHHHSGAPSFAAPSRRVGSKNFAVLLLAAFALLPLGCKKEETAPKPLVYVQATHPEQGTISEQITADATLAPLAQAAISPKITAPVKKFYVQRGARVKAGQLLATLENTDLAAAALDNKGSYDAAQATYEMTTRATVPEDYTKANLDLAQAKANLDLAQSIVTARTALFSQGAIPGRDLDTAKASLVQAQSAYDIAKLHLDSEKAVSNKDLLASAQGNLNSAKGKYLGAEAQLSYTEVHSPIDGFVTDRSLFAGETAAAGTPLLIVMDTSALIAKLHISQLVAQQLSIGAPATLAVPGIPDSIPAKVSLVSPALDPGSTTVEVWLRVENPRAALRPGTPVRATITGRTVKNALTVPAEAIQTGADGNSKSVMVIAADGTARKKVVTLGLKNTENIQILSGVTASDTVITTGGYGLDEGTKVKIGVDPNAKPDDDDKAAAKDGDKADDKDDKPAAGKANEKPAGKDADDK